MPELAAKKRRKNQPIELAGQWVLPGERKTIDLVVGKLYTHSPITMPVQVLCGHQAGPVMFISAAIHGDELNGVEIIRRLLKVPSLKRLKGTLMAVPIVNLHGFINQSRYLPDRRDLNRSFPGSDKGSLAGRVARLFLDEIVERSTHGIDLHTGAVHRSNLPQIRADLDNEETLRLAKAFGTPVVLNSNLRDGSLREAASKKGIPVLLYEAGEALRFDELSIRGGVEGILRVMRQLEMLPASRKKNEFDPIVARSSAWVRAPQDGIFRAKVKQGYRVQKDQTLLAVVSDPFGESEVEIWAPFSGIVIGQLHLPLVNEGEALFHIARFNRTDIAADNIENYQETLEALSFPYL
ncbi:succinylglutamate desuccinylase/aspartoacylase family protein [Thiomicrospira sp. R3]|uniref:succinylglutamate desuccinylase/aspartoacylase family protein n=1 Tax=Thiomicrospira sp. R3 TaxID=3035472 RepID=UPI00259B31EE|nr:succinylglutamate desuccinylase/aspartoacylase family protein [Thiomicrospira sp. R3]WFE68018.1 succinylglutamate desuccinylase/aspartoacylase family protein [Thiomicrospira sp. R3]